MTIPTFNPSYVTGYGTSGQDTARQMQDAATSHSLELSYHIGTKLFTILRSSDFSREVLEKIFAEKTYTGWAPQVLDETDSLGNRIVRLVTIPILREDSSWPVANSRDAQAADLVEKIKYSLRVPLVCKRIIDVGCRSGENTLAMQAAGATVIGIDPDNTEFGTAREKGMNDSQLVKATLQEFHAKEPQMLFDIATVFLWNIPSSERESFVTALKEIIHRDGRVIIGYCDEVYDTTNPEVSVPELMSSAFHSVERREFPGSLNRYMLLCTRPRQSSTL